LCFDRFDLRDALYRTVLLLLLTPGDVYLKHIRRTCDSWETRTILKEVLHHERSRSTVPMVDWRARRRRPVLTGRSGNSDVMVKNPLWSAPGHSHRASGQNVQSHCPYRHCHLRADAYFRQSHYSYDFAEPIIESLTHRLDVVCRG
jgi:hypothetical protein